MDAPIIEISHLTKKFPVERRRYGLKNILLHLPQYIYDQSRKQKYTALNDINLTIRRGERIGLIGHNGCGKTTLLSVIGGVYKKYEGDVFVRGRVSMMLSLGAGFSSKLSGRENIFLNGILQGRTRREMQSLSDEIIEFTGLGDFIDAPVYQYSSGMMARLGFGIATAIQPEILLVDEVLAVGDAAFREKCSERISKLLKQGVTLILVSHNMGQIKRHCKRIIRLDHGRLAADQPIEKAELSD